MSLPLPGKFRFLGNFQDRGQEVSQAHCLGVSLYMTGRAEGRILPAGRPGYKYGHVSYLGVKPTRGPDNLALKLVSFG